MNIFPNVILEKVFTVTRIPRLRLFRQPARARAEREQKKEKMLHAAAVVLSSGPFRSDVIEWRRERVKRRQERKI